jgi:hypothetical protein
VLELITIILSKQCLKMPDSGLQLKKMLLFERGKISGKTFGLDISHAEVCRGYFLFEINDNIFLYIYTKRHAA